MTGPTGAERIAASAGSTGPTGAGVMEAGNVTATITTPDTNTDAPAPPELLRPKFARIPAELKLLKNWLLWVSIWNGSKWTKRPIQVWGLGASTTNPKHWSSFEDVKQAYERAIQAGFIELREKGKPPRRVPIGGIGFVFDGKPDKDGLVFAGADFDKVTSADCREIASLAVERIKRLGSYYERSVSGYGLHVIVKAGPLSAGIAHGGVELYTEGRFFTMTGHAPADTQIVAAPDQFAALVEELRAESTSSRASESAQPPQGGEQTADAEASAWFGKLPAEKQSEVVKYAALHIANHSKLFEVTAHGGNYQDYLKLAFAISRSGVAEAEGIFVEAASIAKDADTQDKLQEFFRNCQHAKPSIKGITVGTLLHTAQQSGANFDQWKRQLPGVLPLPPGKRKPLHGGEYSRNEALELINSHYLIGKSDQEVAIFRIREDELLGFTPLEQFKLDVANIFVRVSAGSAKHIPVEKFWREDPRRHQRKIVFKPGGTTEPDEFNLWRGFGV